MLRLLECLLFDFCPSRKIKFEFEFFFFFYVPVLWFLIELGFNGMSTLVGHFGSSCLPEKGRKEIEEIVEEMKERNRGKRKMNKSEETIEKPFLLFPKLLQGKQALSNCKPISVGLPGDVSYTTPLHSPHPPLNSGLKYCIFTRKLYYFIHWPKLFHIFIFVPTSRQKPFKKSPINLNVTKTCLYNFDLLKPHFYIVKLGFTGVNIIFLISAQNIDCGNLLEPPKKYEKIRVFYLEIFKFLDMKFSIYLNRCVFIIMDKKDSGLTVQIKLGNRYTFRGGGSFSEEEAACTKVVLSHFWKKERTNSVL